MRPVRVFGSCPSALGALSAGVSLSSTPRQSCVGVRAVSGVQVNTAGKDSAVITVQLEKQAGGGERGMLAGYATCQEGDEQGTR